MANPRTTLMFRDEEQLIAYKIKVAESGHSQNKINEALVDEYIQNETLRKKIAKRAEA